MKLAGALGVRGDIEEARAEIAQSLKLKPEMNSVARFRAIESYQEPGFQARHDKTIVLGLRRAGFPEEVAPLPRITREQINWRTHSLSPYKAPGPDGIPNIVLTKNINVIIDHLYYIYVATINLHSYYGLWKHWTMVVLRKPGKPRYDIAKAYHPIALFNTLSKLLTSTITESMTYLSDKHNLLPSMHFGG